MGGQEAGSDRLAGEQGPAAPLVAEVSGEDPRAGAEAVQAGTLLVHELEELKEVGPLA